MGVVSHHQILIEGIPNLLLTVIRLLWVYQLPIVIDVDHCPYLPLLLLWDQQYLTGSRKLVEHSQLLLSQILGDMLFEGNPEPLTLEIQDLQEGSVLISSRPNNMLRYVLNSPHSLSLVHPFRQFGNQLQNLPLPVIATTRILLEQLPYNNQCSLHPKGIEYFPGCVSDVDIDVAELRQACGLDIFDLCEMVEVELRDVLKPPESKHAVVEFVVVAGIDEDCLGLLGEVVEVVGFEEGS